jgi:hypothetical protein
MLTRAVTELAISIAVYALPLAVLPWAVRCDTSAPRVAALSLLLAPLLGVATYLAVTRRGSLTDVAAVLPFAVLPLGFWAALLAALATPILRRAHGRFGDSPSVFVLTSAIGGALTGAAFMFGFSMVVASARLAVAPIELSPHVLAGLCAGAFVAMLATRPFVCRPAA